MTVPMPQWRLHRGPSSDTQLAFRKQLANEAHGKVLLRACYGDDEWLPRTALFAELSHSPLRFTQSAQAFEERAMRGK